MTEMIEYLDRADGWKKKTGTFEPCCDKTVLPVGAHFISNIVRDYATKLPIKMTVEAVLDMHFKAVNNGSIAKDTCFRFC